MAQKRKRYQRKSPHIARDPKIISTALALADEKGWASVTLREISKRSKLPIWDIAERYPQVSDILRHVLKDLSAQIEAEAGAHMTDSWRENLQELLMLRLELTNKNRGGYASLPDLARKDPLTALEFAPMLLDTADSMLKLAKAPIPETYSVAFKVLFSALYLSIIDAWRQDETKDLSKTMAVIDRRLAMFEKALTMVGGQ